MVRKGNLRRREEGGDSKSDQDRDSNYSETETPLLLPASNEYIEDINCRFY